MRRLVTMLILVALVAGAVSAAALAATTPTPKPATEATETSATLTLPGPGTSIDATVFAAHVLWDTSVTAQHARRISSLERRVRLLEAKVKVLWKYRHRHLRPKPKPRPRRRLVAQGYKRVSWFPPQRVAGPYVYREGTLGTAHKTLRFGTLVLLIHRNKRVFVRVIDRGPYIRGREYDLTKAAFARLAPLSAGVITCRVYIVR